MNNNIKKILFINPPLCNLLPGCHSHTTPLGLMYLAAVLEKAGYQAKVLDAELLQLSWDALKQKIKDENPDIIGVSSMSLSLPAFLKTVEICRAIMPQTKIIAGGPGPTFEPEKILKTSQAIDIIVLKEGEKTILDLMQYFKGQKSLNEIKGIAFRQGAEIVITAPQDYINDLDSIPLPAYHLLEPEFSSYPGFHRGNDIYKMAMPNAVIMASRGCPHRCIFCSNNQIRNRRRDPEKIVDEIEFCYKKIGAKSIQFYDDEFIGANPAQNKWIQEICDKIIQRKLDCLDYLVQGRCAGHIELETLKKMQQAGFKWIWWGVESGSQKVLNAIKKDITLDDIKTSFKLARQAGVKSLMFIMVGLPSETEEDNILTGKLIEQIKPDQVRFHITTPFPGSELWDELKSKNQIEDYNFLNYNTRYKAVHHTDSLSSAKINELYQMLVFRYESNKKNLAMAFLKSFFSFDGLKKLPSRVRKIFIYLPQWLKIKSVS